MGKRRTSYRQGRFLAALRRGCTVSEAVAYAGVARSTAYAWAEDAEFEEVWARAEGEAAAVLRRKAFEMAKGGNVRILMWLLDRMEARSGAGEATESVGAIEIIGLEEGERSDGDFITFVENEG